MNTTPLIGLSSQEAVGRLKVDGYDELPSVKPRTLRVIALEVLREPMFLLLVICGAIYLVLADVQDVLMLLGFVFFIMGINLYQQHRTERALEALRDLSSPRALVIRDGRQQRIAGREVVRDDLIILSEGDRVPADATLLSSTNLTVDESLLTGESAHVRKSAWDGAPPAARPSGDNLPFIYSGTLVVQGRGVARIHAVGAQTERGKIGKALETVASEETPLQKEIRRLVQFIAVAAGILCVFVVVVYGFTRGDWLKGLLVGLTLAIAILPNELPVVLAIFLALGAWRMSKERILTRQTPVVETLGSATVLCVDKTGTLTLNQMTTERLFAGGAWYDLRQRPPRPTGESLIGRPTILRSVLQGVGILVIVLAVFLIALARGQGELDARALTFTTLILANLGVIFTNRSWSRHVLAVWHPPNVALWWVTGGHSSC